jgi:hypothetical protein
MSTYFAQTTRPSPCKSVPRTPTPPNNLRLNQTWQSVHNRHGYVLHLDLNAHEHSQLACAYRLGTNRLTHTRARSTCTCHSATHAPPHARHNNSGAFIPNRVKLSNFLPDEDVNIVKSWLEISTDPITNTSQRREGMWERILQWYNTRRGSYDERTVRSLQSRWDTIKTEVGKFFAYYVDALRENASGTYDADKVCISYYAPFTLQFCKSYKL